MFHVVGFYVLIIACLVFVKNQTPPPAPTPIQTLNGTITHPPMNPTPTHTQPSTFNRNTSLTQAQHKFCILTLRNLKKSKNTCPFLFPVNIVAMNISHYPEIVTHPMDFSTIKNKLNNSNLAKPNLNPDMLQYQTADQFIADVEEFAMHGQESFTVRAIPVGSDPSTPSKPSSSW